MSTENQKTPSITFVVQFEGKRYVACYEITEEERTTLRRYLSKDVVRGHAEDWTGGLIDGSLE